MIKNLTNESYLKAVYDYFNCKIYDISFFDYNRIYITDSIKDNVKYFKEDISKRAQEQSTGLLITPNEIIEESVVLVEITNKNKIASHIRSLIHELVHVYDVTLFANYFTNGDLSMVNSHPLCNRFTQWTEFKASAYSELHCFKCLDFIFGVNNTEILMSTYKEDVKDFLEITREKAMSHTLDDYSFCSFLGQLYMYDIYNHVRDVSESCTRQYLPEVFEEPLVSLVQALYDLYFDADQNDRLFENLPAIDGIMSQIYRKH